MADFNLLIVKARGNTPFAVISPRFGAEDGVNEIASELSTPSSRSGQAELKAACLQRDNNRCVLSGIYDIIQAEENLSDAELSVTATGMTELAHILPFSLGSFQWTEA